MRKFLFAALLFAVPAFAYHNNAVLVITDDYTIVPGDDDFVLARTTTDQTLVISMPYCNESENGDGVDIDKAGDGSVAIVPDTIDGEVIDGSSSALMITTNYSIVRLTCLWYGDTGEWVSG